MEIEVKIRLDDPEAIAARVREAGGVLRQERSLEDNRVLDLEGDVLGAAGRLLRVRTFAGRTVVTAKSTPEDAPEGYKVRHEVETEVPDGKKLVRLLETVGFRTRWRYQKYRRTYEWLGAHLMIDEIPYASYLEIEGEPDVIDDVARRLGFDPDRYETDTYRETHARHCRELGIPFGDLVFSEEAEAR